MRPLGQPLDGQPLRPASSTHPARMRTGPAATPRPMRTIDWYFDFISPYAWFAFLRLDELPADVDLRMKPVLFAGLLNHWGQKGPAEIPAKRIWTYRSCAWTAQSLGIPFQAPAAHPFNPLPYLRHHKFWPSVGRVDNVYGDRNLVCSCPPISSYE